MQFKHGSQHRAAWNMYGKRTMKAVGRILDEVSQILGCGELVITSAIRPPVDGKLSYHPCGQALDIRTKGTAKIEAWTDEAGGFSKKEVWLDALKNTVLHLKKFDRKIGFLLEDKNGDNEHLHVQWADGEPM
jgi:hypothetical protein